MTLPSKPITIRLSPESHERFQKLCAEFGGLQSSQILRCIVESVLEQPLPQQIEILTTQIRKPGGELSTGFKRSARQERPNSNRRLPHN